MAPEATAYDTSSSSTSASVISATSGSISAIKSNPFGIISDPNDLRGNGYYSASDILSQTLYGISSKIFSYDSPGSENLLDSYLRFWSVHYGRTNAFGVVPSFNHLEVRSGASNVILGYFSRKGTNGQPITALLGSNGLSYMRPTLSQRSVEKLPLSLNISAIDYDEKTDNLVSNYSSPLSNARALNYPVLTPVNSRDGREIQHLALFNHYLTFLTGSPSVFLFDGPNFSKFFTKFDQLLSVENLGDLYKELLSKSEGDASSDDILEKALDLFNSLAGTSYSFFEYVGSANPKTVFISYGSYESSELANAIQETSNADIGLIQVRVRLPFNAKKFASIIPKSTKSVVILDQADKQTLKADVTAALFMNNSYFNYAIKDFVVPLDFVWSKITISKLFFEFVESFNPEKLLSDRKSQIDEPITANTSPEGQFLFWGKDNGILLDNVERLALSLSLDSSKSVGFRTKFDNSVFGGAFQTSISTSTGHKSSVTVDSADVVIIDDVRLLEHYDVLATTKPGAVVGLLNEKAINNSIEEDFVNKLPIAFRKGLAENHNKLLVIDLSTLKDIDELSSSTKGFSANFLIQLAFWRASYPELGNFIVNKLIQANGNDFELLAAVLDKFIQVVDEKKGTKEVDVSPEWLDLKEDSEEKSEEKKDEKNEKKEREEKEEAQPEEVVLPFFPKETSFLYNPRDDGVLPEETIQSGYVDLATKISFPEAFNLKKDLKPDLPVKNFVVKVKENKRLTPLEYSRNIFHIDFDITGTDLTYDIGEALGIHGRNNEEEVEKFLKFYGVDGDSLVETTHRDDASLHEIRSARQLLTENVDFLGKPPKRFYEGLAAFATDEKEKKHLEALGGSEGTAELKKRQDEELLTYVDLLEEFKSARPEFSELVKIISPLKRREYSIASSQKMHPNSVQLLVVVVDWVDPRGRIRYGQCSKYLSDLRVGEELVVSVKPSVMKLPVSPAAPIVMSGLGTGLAPFKAFVEEKIWQRQQGHEIGDIYLYMGSRHKKEEYLYGELWEAYKDAGILTHIGAAFSRDQPEKIYIQDKIRESIHELTDAIVNKNGSFYLCGPTWPVPDITACLEDIVQAGAKDRGEHIKDIAKVVEDMKEDNRYILEVY